MRRRALLRRLPNTTELLRQALRRAGAIPAAERVAFTILGMRRLALFLIRFYQVHISPHKGFSCAYRACSGRAGCSQLGFRAIRRAGLWRGLGILRERMQLCGEAHRRLQQHLSRRDTLAGQRGVCDVSCDVPGDLSCGHFDLPSCGHGGGCSMCDVLSCSDCGECSGCDWPGRNVSRRNRNADGNYVYIPPNSKWKKPE